jgi:hypothetical protein
MKSLNSRNKIIIRMHKITGFPFSVCRNELKTHQWNLHDYYVDSYDHGENDYYDLEHILELSFTTFYTNKSSFKDITYHNWVLECDIHQYIYIFRLRFKGDVQLQFGIHDSKVCFVYFTNEYGEDFLDRMTEIVKRKITAYIK